jgi:hypothetical protein
MYHKNYLALFLFLICFGTINAQQNLKELTNSIIDTSQTKYVQAFQIYKWIITNIEYDIKSYADQEVLNYAEQEVLKKRKGLCDEFTMMFRLMCEKADIEAYSISTYFKGPGYYSGRPFLRAEHSINVFLYDSKWHFVDPTFGSGYILEDSKVIKKLLKKGFKLPAPKEKYKFIASPDTTLFDIPVELLIKKQYPLDPKWFATDQPYSFKSFEKDSAFERTPYPDFYNNIESIRGTSPENVLKHEGINSRKFNNHNFFDLANGYIIVASNYYLEKNIIRTNVQQFEGYSKEFGVAYDAIKKHISLNDSVYRERKSSLKSLSQDHKRISNKIDSKAKSAQSSFRSGNQRISGKSDSYQRKFESYLLKSEKTKIQIVPEVYRQDSLKTDAKKIQNLYSDLIVFELGEPELQFKTDSFFTQIDAEIKKDAMVDDSINFKNYLFADIIINLNNAIERNNEDSIRDYVDTLLSVYFEIGDLLAKKKSSKSVMQEKSKGYYNFSGQLQSNLKNQTNILKKCYRETNYSDSARIRYNSALQRLISSYEQSMKYTRKLDNHIMLQADSREVNLKALKMQRKEINREFRNFTAWYELQYERDEKKYRREKEIAKIVMSYAQSNKRLVDSKLKKYYQSLQKDK